MASLLFILAVLGAETCLIRPWGNFPLNDDWGHALLTLSWAQTGHFSSFISITPSILIQAWLGKTLIGFFGFSHGLLRVVNLVGCALWLLILDRLLRLVGADRRWRLLLLAVALANPLITNLTFSYMSDIWGMTIAYAGVLLWFHHLKVAGTDGWGAKSAALALAAGLLIGASFWTRQLSILVFPGIALARLAEEWRAARWIGVRRAIARYLPTTLLFVATVEGYFVWARRTHNLNADFSNKLEFLPWSKDGYVPLQLFIFFLYATAFVLPALLLVARPREVVAYLRHKAVAIPLALLWLVMGAIFLTGDHTYLLLKSIHFHFPILGNVLNPYGIGPITLTDVYLHNGPRLPTFHPTIWIAFELLTLGGAAYWAVVADAGRNETAGGDGSGLAREGFWFGVFTFAATWFVTSGFFGRAVIDRYVVAVLPSTIVLLAAAVGRTRISLRRLPAGLALLAAFVIYGVGSTHDYFRWNEARWDLVRAAAVNGIASDQIDGGYELNAWEFYRKGDPHGDRHCANGWWFCDDRPYTIALNVDTAAGQETIAAERPAVFFRNFPDVLLVRKAGAQPASRQAGTPDTRPALSTR